MGRLEMIIAVLALLLSMALVVSTATAQAPICIERSMVVSQLASQYLERPVAMGIANNGGVLEILSSRAGQSWTIILTMPNGVTCMVAAGKSWEILPVLSRLDPAS